MSKVSCVCGGTQFRKFKKVPWIVTSAGVTKESPDMKMTLGECKECGVIRQMDLPFSTQEEYIDFYENKYPPINEVYKAKTYEHDHQLAVLRCNEYGIGQGSSNRILDIGSGSGAFVDECRKRGADACGCEVTKYACEVDGSFIYRKCFEDIHFPTDHFNKVTCHDILEHVLDPIKFLKEIFRVLNQGGHCFIDLPRFFHESGKHHWKHIEHIWYFTTEQLEKILKEIGFVLTSVQHPIESKTVFQVIKPSQERTSILLPPGIGDSYWSIVKMEAFLEQEKLGIPDIYVACPQEKRFQGHKRAFPFIEMFPFLNSTGITLESKKRTPERRVWNEAYAEQGRTIFRDVLGCDYFLSYNGHLRFGEQLEQIDPHFECNWNPLMFVSLEQEYFKEVCLRRYGKYIVFHFMFQGTYKYWIEQFPITNVIKFIQEVIQQTNLTPVFTGALWDKDDDLLNQVKEEIPNCIDLVGKTNIAQLFGLLTGSEMVVGYPSGLTIMSAVFQKKTLIIWNDYYHRDFAWNSCPPCARRKTYFAENTKGLSVDYLVEKAKEIIYWGKGDQSIMCRIDSLPPCEITQGSMKKGKRKRIKTKEKTTNMKKISVKNISVEGKKEVTVVCVLKSGGTFIPEYVVKLRNMVARNTTIPHNFLCLTDFATACSVLAQKQGIWVEVLGDNLTGWWSKLELFRPGLCTTKRVLYFDLDTIILNNIDHLLTLDHEFYALEPWNMKNREKGRCASGMMAWHDHNEFSFIYKEFKNNGEPKGKGGDQAFISECLIQHEIQPKFLQKEFKGIYSYKRNCRDQVLPKDARIICFHGKPRLHDVKEKWVQENWI